MKDSLLLKETETLSEFLSTYGKKQVLRGRVPARIKANDCSFECRLIPNGKDFYYIPVNKSYAGSLEGLLDASIEFIASLSRISHDSPYSTEHPVRIIDSIKEIDIVPGYCGHCCIAMLAGVSLEDVQALMGKAPGSWSKIMETLDYYGISYSEKMVYPKGDDVCLPKRCIAYIDGGFYLWYKGRFYGTSAEKQSAIISCLEIAAAGNE